jgi:hypothetical protein
MAVACPFVLRYEGTGTLQQKQVLAFRKDLRSAVESNAPMKNGFPVEPGESWYRFVGECYIRNMMNDEAFRYLNERTDDWDLGGKLFEIR